jgi:hypothetical protein
MWAHASFRLAGKALGPAAAATVTAVSFLTTPERASLAQSTTQRVLLHTRTHFTQQASAATAASKTTMVGKSLAQQPAAPTSIVARALSTAPQKQTFLQWYEGHLQARPVFTKMCTGTCLWSIGDAVAQIVPHYAYDKESQLNYDWARTGRAAFFGFAIHAPTSHVHYNFLEWMTQRAGLSGLKIPLFKAFMEQVSLSCILYDVIDLCSELS